MFVLEHHSDVSIAVCASLPNDIPFFLEQVEAASVFIKDVVGIIAHDLNLCTVFMVMTS